MNPDFDHITDSLLVKYLLAEATSDERVQVEVWLAASVANTKYFEQLKVVWEESKHLAAITTVDEEAAWQRFQNRIHRLPAIQPVQGFAWWRIAALFVLVTGAALLTYTLVNKEQPVQSLVVQSGSKIMTDTLPDGSVVTLNKASRLIYPDHFTGGTRSVQLEGEAFFKVTPDAKKPFVIQVNDVTVKVVGTSFNVRSEQGRTEVIVETGIVQVMKQNKVVQLHPRERVMVQKEDTILRKEVEQDQLYNYYRTKEFVCDSTPLWKLVEVLNEAYSAHIVIEKEELRSLPLTATFYNESLDRILDVISKTFDISVVKSGEKIILR
ncbi:MAG: FecR domain-containing protein [Flavisolibacter sp.]|nr:FecR domain-containing protein [Flavisolibacter sp.]